MNIITNKTEKFFLSPLLLACLLAVVARITCWVLAIYFPIPNETGVGISPLNAKSGIDLGFYMSFMDFYSKFFELLFSGNFSVFSVLENLKPDIDGATYDIATNEIRNSPNTTLFSPPLLPILLIIFNYGEGNAWPISLLYLLISSFLACCWIKWMYSRGIYLKWLLLFSILPGPFWYMLNISTDLLFSLCVAIFYWKYFQSKLHNKTDYLILLFIAIIAIGVRPNGLALFIFIITSVIFFSNFNLKLRFIVFVASGILFVVFWGIFDDYLLHFINSSSKFKIFGHFEYEYYSGIFEFLPELINKFISIICLFCAKILYLCGFRPSYGDTNVFFVFLRASASLILIPGFIRCVMTVNNSERLFLFWFLLPIILGAAQERYILPIMPVFFIHGVKVYSMIWEKTFARFLNNSIR